MQRLEKLIIKGATEFLSPEETAEMDKLLDEVDEATLERLRHLWDVSEIAELERRLEDPNAIWISHEAFKKLGIDRPDKTQ